MKQSECTSFLITQCHGKGTSRNVLQVSIYAEFIILCALNNHNSRHGLNQHMGVHHAQYDSAMTTVCGINSMKTSRVFAVHDYMTQDITLSN